MRPRSIKQSDLRKRLGSTLSVAMTLMALASFGSLVMMRTMIDHQRLNERRRSLARAYYIAQAGVQQVVHWGDHADDLTINPTLFRQAVPDPGESVPLEDGQNALVSVNVTAQSLFSNLNAALSHGEIVITSPTLQFMNVGSFVSDGNMKIGDIDHISLVPPETGDPVPCFFKVRSVGRAPAVNGAKFVLRTVESYLDVNSVIGIRLPAALLSFNVASAAGNAKVHWGESWTLNKFTPPAKPDLSYLNPFSLNYDRWAKYRTEAYIDFNAVSSWKQGLGQDVYDLSRQQPGALPASGFYANAFYQHLPAGTLKWPTFDYNTFKNMAISHGRYYTTDSSGNLYRGSVKDSAHKVSSFLDEFGVANRADAPWDLVFIDTTNGLPPATDGSNLATISASGNSKGLKGIFYINANFDGSGVGSPLPITYAKDPWGHPPASGQLSKIFLDGVLYSAGTVALSGNAGIYGSLVTQRGFAGGGTPDIWYNAQLADGIPLKNGNAGSTLRVVLQKNY